ncbi:2-oxoacid:acceptor oxidoreductase family protein [Candidatus Fermentibacteria bacterium]|nr:2-oxoacid:acceptor oxidoreductase family protein [Candidatus Fermentibacteria bacterium]
MAETIFRKAKSFYDVYERKAGANKDVTHYCPGCGHGILHKLIAEAMDDFDLKEHTVLISPVGCSVFAYYYFDCGNIQAAHGRAPAVATGVKRTNPDSVVISYQGDGDLAGIGGNEILQAANRGERISVFFVNNAIYGMTGGQMAPTTLLGMRTTTSPHGRSIGNEGYPLHMCELISTLEAPVYVERVSLTDAKHIMQARRAVRKALKAQMEGKGFTFVEALSACPTNWKVPTREANRWIVEMMEPVFPIKVFKDEIETREVVPREKKTYTPHEIVETLDLPTGDETVSFVRPPNALKDPEIKVAGFGGQGVLLLGLALAQAGMRAGYHVTWLPSYGPEMRGGTANCHVRIAEGRIGSPLVHESDVLIAFNGPSLDKFASLVKPGGLILYDSSLIDRTIERTDVKALGLPFTELADKELGNGRASNFVAMGAFIVASRGVFDEHVVKSILPLVIKRKNLIELNERAVAAGMRIAREALGS